MPKSEEYRIAYVLLWFPLSSETFIFKEVGQLQKKGLSISIYTMYEKALKGCSREMLEYGGPVCRMGSKALCSILWSFFKKVWRRPRFTSSLMRECLLRKMRNLESQAENTWCFFAGFLLADLCKKQSVSHLHAPWANGPATAAWVASRLTGIPFTFTGRAGDIYPPDGLLTEKSRDAVFIRTNNASNLKWLARFCDSQDKLKLVYNGLTFSDKPLPASRKPSPPYRIISIGRFARTKGFPYLLTALARLRRENFDCRLVLVGNGAWRGKLERLRKRLDLMDRVEMPGFIPNDRLALLMAESDVLVVPSVIHANGDRDGIPNVIMEACSLALPVIATDVCGISEVIRNNETGYLVPQRSASALAKTIRVCLENYEHAKKMAMNAKMEVASMFDSEKNASILKELFIKALPEK